MVQIVRRRLFAASEGRRYELSPQASVPLLRENAAFAEILAERLDARKQHALELAADAHLGRFRFLSAQQTLSQPIDWRLPRLEGVTPLWRFHLHYQEYLLDLAAAALKSDRKRHLDRAWELAASWIEGNHPGDRRAWADAWHPYCIARRLPVWMLLWSVEPPQSELADRVLQSMVLQARFLSHHLELDLGGNHLLEDLRALAMAGAFFAGAEADGWLDFSGGLLQRELKEQVLPYGEHFERSPMYHCQMLDAVLDIRDVTRSVRGGLSADCQQAATQMAEFLLAILHPDGQIPLLSDSAFDEAGDPCRLARRAGVAVAPARDGALRVGDYWRFADGGDWLLLDAGPVGADHLPAHAHADLLTCEASIDGKRLFVDSGVFNYQDDAMRAYCRGTAAHNALTIDAADQCDVYSRFRMGRRGWPVGFASGESEGFAWVCAAHNAYRFAGVPRVERYLACRKGGPWICVDRACGRGRHALDARLHIHPDWHVEMLGEHELAISSGETQVRLCALGPCRIELAKGWYCGEFGVRVENTVVCLCSESELPAACGWMLKREGSGDEAALEAAAGQTPVVTIHDIAANRTIRLQPCG